jgi:hypothetical protein
MRVWPKKKKYHERDNLVSCQEREFTWAVKERESKLRVEWCGKYLEYFVNYITALNIYGKNQEIKKHN